MHCSASRPQKAFLLLLFHYRERISSPRCLTSVWAFVSRATLSSACWTRCRLEGGVCLHPCPQNTVSCLLKVTLHAMDSLCTWRCSVRSWIHVKAKPFYLQSNLKYVILTFPIMCNGDTLMHCLTLHVYHFRVSEASGYHNALSSERLYLHVSLNVPCWHSVMSLLSCHSLCWK